MVELVLSNRRDVSCRRSKHLCAPVASLGLVFKCGGIQCEGRSYTGHGPERQNGTMQVMPVTSHASEAFEAFPRLSCVAVVVVVVVVKVA